MKLLLLLVVLIVSVKFSILTGQSEFLKKGKSRFIFSSPKTLTAGQSEIVCLSLHDAFNPFEVLVQLKIRDKMYPTTHTITSDNECFNIFVPKLRSHVKVAQFASLHLQFQLNGKMHSGHANEPVLIYPNTNLVFIETDKSVYKPNDKVRIRILVLTPDLKAPLKFNIPIIKILNPNGNTVTVWENIPTELGLSQLEHQLPSDVTKGKWTIDLVDTSNSFEVNSYVLPRFAVKIHGPKNVYVATHVVKFTICGQYFYGQDVKGIGMIRITLNQNQHSINKAKQLHNGCANLHFTNEELNLNLHINTELFILGTVTEYRTDRAETTTRKSIVTNKPYNLKFLDISKHFQPGLPYYGQIKAFDSLVALNNEVIEVCYNVAVEKIWNIKEIKQCSNFTFGRSDTIHFHILPVKDNVIQIRLYAKSLNHTINQETKGKSYPEALNKQILAYFTLNRWYSPSNSYIQVEQSNHILTQCKTSQQFTVYYTTVKLRHHENITFHYMVKSRDKMYKIRTISDIASKQRVINYKEITNIVGTSHRYIKKESFAGKFILKFKLDPQIITKYELVIYHILKNGEVIAANLDVPIESCLLNKVETIWTNNQYYPGKKASLTIKTVPKSLCAVSSTDKAATYWTDNEKFDVSTILKATEKNTKRISKFNCLPRANRKAVVDTTLPTTQRSTQKRIKRYYGMSSPYQYDTFEAFSNFGVAVITNMKLLSKPCIPDSPLMIQESNDNIDTVDSAVQFLTNSMPNTYYNVYADNHANYIRSFFPETWLWELVPIGNYETTISRDLPHTITNWVTNTVCISSNTGIGISAPTEITVFQPFFLEVLSPYSIKRYEYLHLEVVLYNYLNYSLPVRITLGFSDGLVLVDNPDERSEVHCIAAENSETITFGMEGTKFGKSSIHVLAELESSYPEDCGPEITVNKRDMVVKEIWVEAEGHPVSSTKSILLCINDTTGINTANWSLELPGDMIEHSAKAKLIINGDLLGPSIHNLDKFLIVPTGCGEQIMATLAPNLYILKYLKAIGISTPSLQQRVRRNLKIGYQRILDYVHNDGSFSAFGYHDQTGSMFLTAFVVKILQLSKAYIYVDQNVINNAVRWIINNQLENGCFATVSHVFHDMGGSYMENSTAALTSYVIISLIESGIDVSEKVRTNAKYCIRGHFSADKYTLAISTYALSLVGWESEAKRCLAKLLQVATEQDHLMWWSSTGAISTNVEMTGYVLMSLVHQNSSNNLIYANSVVRWLASQRGPKGGFVSTQDTVVALDAITKYAILIYSSATDLQVNLTVGKKEYEIIINANDRLKTKEQIVKELPNNVSLTIEGKGCVLVQSLLEYNLYQVTNSEAFKLAVDVDSISNVDQCAVAMVSTCVSYTGPGLHSNMAILEITMPSGYEPDRASLYKLVDDSYTKVKKFEENANQVVLYFTEVNREPICVPFYINELSKVDGRLEANVKLYDYYNPDLKVVTTYKVSQCYLGETVTVPPLPEMNRTNAFNKEQVSGDNVMENLIDTDVESENKINYKLNPDFIDMDIDMAVPNGEEGNIPVYIKPENVLSNGD
ncbi:hypothetical protein RN001_001741 [Aquatica leii]|uniref:Uncharacterized protein n=1 Tax=Aquatica leii TaxID=1421715 RepID=A0AAN7QAL7_9COLE|nr:hypothetical protein RN001_001741 [Aquatica leii]